MTLKWVALLVVLATVAHASTIDVITSEKLSLFKALADSSGATKALSNNGAHITVLAPTNQAVEAFLKDMDLTVNDLKTTEALADAILGYHLVLGVTAGPKELFAKSDSVKVPTAIAPYDVVFKKTASGVTVTDFQGNVAKVLKADLGTGNTRVHVIDRVLYSGAYWTSLGKLVSVLPGQFSTLKAAADASGLTSVLTEKGFNDTVFLPTNKAFQASGMKLDAPATRIADVLAYHVVKGRHPIPRGFVSGQPVTTLQGQNITVTYKQGAKVDNQLVRATAYVTDATGTTVKIIQPNVFISKATAHVIDGVLMPKGETPAPAPAAATAAGAAGTKKPAAQPANPPMHPAPASSAAPAPSDDSGAFYTTTFIDFIITQQDPAGASTALPGQSQGGRRLLQL